MSKKKITLFLLVIYLTFISLGLPDSVLGTAWPVMYDEFHVSSGAAGLIAMVVAICTVISSLKTVALVQRFGTARLVIFSVLLTAVGLLGFGVTQQYLFFVLFAIPLGLGAGAIDTALNDYVALHFKAHHMNWLHGFWGIGATLGPMIMGTVLLRQWSWRSGYFLLGGLQLIVVIVLLFSLPLWRMPSKTAKAKQSNEAAGMSIRETLRIPGVWYSVLSFIFYVGIEASMGLWGSSYLILVKGTTVGHAGFIVSAFYASLTIGRMVSGFLTFRFSNRFILYMSEVLLLVGVFLIFLFEGSLGIIGFALTGLGSAAIFPTMLHETPTRFGVTHSGQVMGVQIGLAYIGTAGLPFLLGLLGETFSMAIFPPMLMTFGVILLVATIRIEKITENKEKRGKNDNY
ncbi:MFS transporter [Candidatus Enterococcus clewellii]|nr:MFS transporter [Enterococcus sp. 9E7_DIV0242]